MCYERNHFNEFANKQQDNDTLINEYLLLSLSWTS